MWIVFEINLSWRITFSVGKKYDKADTFHIASLGCLDSPQKMSYVSHVRKLGSTLFFKITHAPNDEKSTSSNIDMLLIIL